ncbi:MAG: indolepyruvate ferredoxin oxidoreductase family protein [Actinomycetota bacterium]
MSLVDFKLEDRFGMDEGDVAMSGVQALLRVLLDQLRADRRDGLNNAAMVSGYRGSPLGGMDSLFLGNKAELDANNVTFIPGLNEDLGATAVWGSQLANYNWEGRYDGVLGMWYGKAPGVDRSGDAIRHANVSGVDPNGGVLLVAGDDPASKSSTLTAESEFILVHFETPIFYPGSVQEVADFGRWGYALSRYSGLWSSIKIVTNVADGYSTIRVGPGRVRPSRPAWEWNGKPWAHSQEDRLFGPLAVAMEREVYEGRIEAAKHFIAHNDLNKQTVDTSDAKLGIVAAGKTYYDVRAALDKLGLDEGALRSRGVRIFKPAVVWPLEERGLRRFAEGLDTIVIVEEKRAFIETLAREALYGMPNAPRILGKRHADGSLWFPGYGEMDADGITKLLRPFLVEQFGEAAVAPAERERVMIPLIGSKAGTSANRAAGFCSGCPHNTSTWVPEGSEAGGGIGCHGMAGTTPDRNTKGTSQMGGEGIAWVGAAPFVTLEHRFQNIGDGTYHHSGSLALRQAVAAGTNITYKILYNGAVAMTGGQDVDGQMQVPELTRSIHAEGVAKIMVVTDDPKKYPSDANFALGTDIWHRSRMDEAQRLLRDVRGCTVLIYDQACAAELRRDRKRGKIADPAMRIFINEAVCEGCGDCGVKSSCLSVQPVETEFGRKTRIHQSSCNKDYTCVEGDCPAFVEVIPDPNAVKKATVPFDPIGRDDLPEPDRIDEGDVLMMGIGGTGVVTVNQLLATAALLDGKRADGLDQTGLSQKGGSVISNLKIRRTGDGDSAATTADGALVNDGIANKVSTGEADAYLVFDVLTGTSDVNLEKTDPNRTVAIVSSSKVPTGSMVRDTSAAFPEWAALQARIDATTAADRNVYFDAGTVSDSLFRSHMPANVIVLGAGYQQGVIPISADAIERAIELNGVAVESNIQAFRIGRKIAMDPSWIEAMGLTGAGDGKGRAAARAERRRSKVADKLIAEVADPSAELTRLLGIRVPDLIDYQDAAYARRYVAKVAQVRAAESAVGDDTRLSEAVARYLYKLMAYKDEYEVARLHRSSSFKDALAEQFGDGATITYKLHPPTMRRLGYDSKIGLGRSGEMAFAALARMKRLRGTVLDPFGRTGHRRLERELIDEYEAMVDKVLDGLAAGNMDRAVEVAELPDGVRGYEGIKEDNVAEFRSKAQQLLK